MKINLNSPVPAINSLSQVAEIQLSYRPAVKPSLRPKVQKSQEAYDVFLNSWDLDKLEFIEQFKVMLLNRANKVIGVLDLSSGGFSGTYVDVKMIFSAALKACASCIMLAHNHPSGNLKPSDADKQITNKIKQAGKLLDMELLDHIILTGDGYLSFADEGFI